MKIDDYDKFKKIIGEYNIDVPRLRYFSFMWREKPLYIPSKSEIEAKICEDLCCSEPFWSYPVWIYSFDENTTKRRKKYIHKGKVQWDKIHGRIRKILKYAVKKETVKYLEQKTVWDKYVGKPVLHMRARIGGGNWKHYGGKDIEKQPWFLEKVDDPYDSTYCDVYANLDIE